MYVSYEYGRLLMNIFLAKELADIIDWSMTQPEMYNSLRSRLRDGFGCPAVEVYIRKSNTGELKSQAAIIMPSLAPRNLSIDFGGSGDSSDVATLG